MTDLSESAPAKVPTKTKPKKQKFLCGMRKQLLSLRRVPFEGTVTDERCNKLIRHCAALAELDRELPVTILFNSRGGDIDAMDALIDRFGALGVRLQGVVIGQASSAALDIFLRCDRRKRFVLPRASVLPHFSSLKVKLIARSEEQLLADAQKFAKDHWRDEERGRRWICERTGLPPESLPELLSDGQDLRRALNAERMVALGFAAGILEDFDFKKPHPKLEPWAFEAKAETASEASAFPPESPPPA